MRTAIMMLGCLLVSAALAGEAVEKNAAAQAKAMPAVVAKASARHAAQPAKTEVPARVWSLEMACCEPQ
ncbi:MAG TPA: hypothetical protein VFK92_09780 [Burkholderiales bacterium]|nr:hypothetical protein [Burkholderiales bacterium]